MTVIDIGRFEANQIDKFSSSHILEIKNCSSTKELSQFLSQDEVINFLQHSTHCFVIRVDGSFSLADDDRIKRLRLNVNRFLSIEFEHIVYYKPYGAFSSLKEFTSASLANDELFRSDDIFLWRLFSLRARWTRECFQAYLGKVVRLNFSQAFKALLDLPINCHPKPRIQSLPVLEKLSDKCIQILASIAVAGSEIEQILLDTDVMRDTRKIQCKLVELELRKGNNGRAQILINKYDYPFPATVLPFDMTERTQLHEDILKARMSGVRKFIARNPKLKLAYSANNRTAFETALEGWLKNEKVLRILILLFASHFQLPKIPNDLKVLLIHHFKAKYCTRHSATIFVRGQRSIENLFCALKAFTHHDISFHLLFTSSCEIIFDFYSESTQQFCSSIIPCKKKSDVQILADMAFILCLRALTDKFQNSGLPYSNFDCEMKREYISAVEQASTLPFFVRHYRDEFQIPHVFKQILLFGHLKDFNESYEPMFKYIRKYFN